MTIEKKIICSDKKGGVGLLRVVDRLVYDAEHLGHPDVSICYEFVGSDDHRYWWSTEPPVDVKVIWPSGKRMELADSYMVEY